MKTTQNVALVAVPMIRECVSEIRLSLFGEQERRDDALDRLDELANQLEQYAGATGTSHTDDTAPSAASV